MERARAARKGSRTPHVHPHVHACRRGQRLRQRRPCIHAPCTRYLTLDSCVRWQVLCEGEANLVGKKPAHATGWCQAAGGWNRNDRRISSASPYAQQVIRRARYTPVSTVRRPNLRSFSARLQVQSIAIGIKHWGASSFAKKTY